MAASNSPVAAELAWDEQRRANRARQESEHREWLKNFTLAIALIALTIAVATALAGLAAAAK